MMDYDNELKKMIGSRDELELGLVLAVGFAAISAKLDHLEEIVMKLDDLVSKMSE